MLGLGGFVLLAVSSAFGELEQAVETTATSAWCQGCGVAAQPHGRRPVRVRDLPSSGRPVTLLWLECPWRCTEPACARTGWSEVSDHVRARASMTERARQEACRLVGEEGLDVAAVAAMLGVGWHTVMRAVRDYGRPPVDDRARTAGVVTVGVDETAFLAPSAGYHMQFVTGIVALPGPGRPRAQLLYVVPGRTGSAVQQWISAPGPAWRERVADRLAAPVPRLRRRAVHQPARGGGRRGGPGGRAACRRHARQVRLVVRRVRPTPGSQLALFTAWDYHAFVTDRDLPLAEVEVDHRRHAVVEQTIAELKTAGLRHLPSGNFTANAAWLALAVMAHNLGRAVGQLAGAHLERATAATLRRNVFTAPGRLVHSGRRRHLRLPASWAWADAITTALARIHAIPLRC